MPDKNDKTKAEEMKMKQKQLNDSLQVMMDYYQSVNGMFIAISSNGILGALGPKPELALALAYYAEDFRGQINTHYKERDEFTRKMVSQIMEQQKKAQTELNAKKEPVINSSPEEVPVPPQSVPIVAAPVESLATVTEISATPEIKPEEKPNA